MNELHKYICRVCLRNRNDTGSDKYLSLFENYKDMLLSEHIESIASVEIREGDGLPDRICPECLLQLDGALAFRQKCKFSDTLLRGAELILEPSDCKHEPDKVEPDDACTVEYLEPDIKSDTECSDTGGSNVVKIEEMTRSFKCETSELSANTEKATRESRSIDLKLICDDCGGTFKSKCKLRVHWKKVHLAEKLTCTKCLYKFKDFKAYNKHVKIYNCGLPTGISVEPNGKSRTYCCQYCSYKCRDLRRMKLHLATHTGEKNLQCKYCPKKFIQYGTLAQHHETHKEHSLGAPLTCHICGKVIFGQYKFKNHVKAHKLKSAQCTICNKILKTSNNLSNHMKRHGGVKPHKCEMCPLTFYFAADKLIHQNNVHIKDTTKYKYKCDMCEFATMKKYVYIKHRSKHTGSNIPCLVCGAWYDDAGKFAAHKKLHEENKYQCYYCDKRYATNDSRRDHINLKHKDKIKPEVVKKIVRHKMSDSNVTPANNHTLSPISE